MSTPLEILAEHCRERCRKNAACPHCGGVFRYTSWPEILCDGCGLGPLEAQKAKDVARWERETIEILTGGGV